MACHNNYHISDIEVRVVTTDRFGILREPRSSYIVHSHKKLQYLYIHDILHALKSVHNTYYNMYGFDSPDFYERVFNRFPDGMGLSLRHSPQVARLLAQVFRFFLQHSQLIVHLWREMQV